MERLLLAAPGFGGFGMAILSRTARQCWIALAGGLVRLPK
jgi:hypothetical protein